MDTRQNDDRSLATGLPISDSEEAAERRPVAFLSDTRPRAGRTVLALVVPCFNESEVLPLTIPRLTALIDVLARAGRCSPASFTLLVDDGSADRTWSIIETAARNGGGRVRGLRLASNVGHQAALVAGLTYATDRCHVAISIDADLQDDVAAIDRMLEQYHRGNELVLGVRAERPTDSRFKRGSAQVFYRLMTLMGVNLVENHADFRLMSNRALRSLAEFPERNLFLRCMPSLLHSRVATVEYTRSDRLAGATKYPLAKMLELAWNGITSFSAFPLHLISYIGGLIFFVSLMLAAYSTFKAFAGETLPGWASITVPLYLLGGMVMLSIGVVGEYIGKIFLETKRRPRFLIDEVIGEAPGSAQPQSAASGAYRRTRRAVDRQFMPNPGESLGKSAVSPNRIGTAVLGGK